MHLGHTVVSSGPLLDDAYVQGNRGVADAAYQAVSRQRVQIVWRGERPLRRESAALSWASEPTVGCALGDTASCGVRLRAMDFHSAHPCTLQSIIHDDGAVQKATIVMSAGGCHKYNEPGHREVSAETRTSSPCPVQPVLWTVP